jgi:hypothetical protein
MSDVSLSHKFGVEGYVEPFNDPLQNFYATSSVERRQRMTCSPSSSLGTLDESQGHDSTAPFSPVSYGGFLDQMVALSESPNDASTSHVVRRLHAAPANPTTGGGAESSPVDIRQPTAIRRHAVYIERDPTTVDDAGVALDFVDGLSLCADSGIESIAPHSRQVSVKGKAPVRARDAADLRRTAAAATAPKRTSHVRSSSDCITTTRPVAAAAESGE